MPRTAFRRAVLSLATLAVLAPVDGRAATASVLYSFSGGTPGALVADGTGALYGATGDGGLRPGACPDGCGTIFKLSPPARAGGTWTEHVLYRFQGGADGAQPAGSLHIDAHGALYGTTGAGKGTVFALRPPAAGKSVWTKEILHRFGGPDGATPQGGLIADRAGRLYGTTQAGGPAGAGVVFRLTPPAGAAGWRESVLHAFPGGLGGASPAAALVLDKDGALFGATYLGGPAFWGFVYRLAPPAAGKSAWSAVVLHGFTGGSDGSGADSLRLDASGTLYGTTLGGGTQSGTCPEGCGTVFRLTPPAAHGGWTESLLYRFKGGTDGDSPGALVGGANGVLYGTTSIGGLHGDGTVFRLAPPAAGQTAWHESVIYSFSRTADGAHPGGLLAGADGMLYGTTASGGAANWGTLFEIHP